MEVGRGWVVEAGPLTQGRWLRGTSPGNLEFISQTPLISWAALGLPPESRELGRLSGVWLVLQQGCGQGLGVGEGLGPLGENLPGGCLH